MSTSSGRRRTGLVLAGSVLAGLSAALVVDTWLGVVEGSWLANAGVLTLTVLAIASAMAGLYALLGRQGLGLGAAAMILVGNPFIGGRPGALQRRGTRVLRSAHS